MDFKPGDFVTHVDDKVSRPRIVIRYRPGWFFSNDNQECIQVFVLGDTDLASPNPIKYYRHISITNELIKKTKKGIELLFTEKLIDNLTFIEISARLREYERQA